MTSPNLFFVSLTCRVTADDLPAGIGRAMDRAAAGMCHAVVQDMMDKTIGEWLPGVLRHAPIGPEPSSRETGDLEVVLTHRTTQFTARDAAIEAMERAGEGDITAEAWLLEQGERTWVGHFRPHGVRTPAEALSPF